MISFSTDLPLITFRTMVVLLLSAFNAHLFDASTKVNNKKRDVLHWGNDM